MSVQAIIMLDMILKLTAVELPEIENRTSNPSGVLRTTLHVNISTLKGPIEWDRRSFEGAPTGPTLRVRPGDRLEITLINQLGTEAPTKNGKKYTDAMEKGTQNGTNYTGDWMHDRDVYAYPNQTNLHLHGMHISPIGNNISATFHSSHHYPVLFSPPFVDDVTRRFLLSSSTLPEGS